MRLFGKVFFAVSVCFVLLASGGFVLGGEIRVDNLREGERVGYELLLIKGAAGGGADCIRVSGGGESRSWDVVEGRYKAMVQLDSGLNRIRLEAEGDGPRDFTVYYEPKRGGEYVRLVYVIAADSDGRFQAPYGAADDIECAKKKIAFAGLLMQTATAELMYEAGYGRKTFRLMRDSSGEVATVVHRSRLSMGEAHGMDGHGIYKKLYKELSGVGRNCRNLAIMQMTRFDAGAGKAYAHTALGAGSLALMGSGGLHAWAEGLDDIGGCFSDQRRVDSVGLLDDSAFRKTFWANYATGLGACLHEIGHSFGLDHSGDNRGIMERGFDRINRVFMLTEGMRAFESERIRWAPESARILAAGRWLD